MWQEDQQWAGWDGQRLPMVFPPEYYMDLYQLGVTHPQQLVQTPGVVGAGALGAAGAGGLGAGGLGAAAALTGAGSLAGTNAAGSLASFFGAGRDYKSHYNSQANTLVAAQALTNMGITNSPHHSTPSSCSHQSHAKGKAGHGYQQQGGYQGNAYQQQQQTMAKQYGGQQYAQQAADKGYGGYGGNAKFNKGAQGKGQNAYANNPYQQHGYGALTQQGHFVHQHGAHQHTGHGAHVGHQHGAHSGDQHAGHGHQHAGHQHNQHLHQHQRPGQQYQQHAQAAKGKGGKKNWKGDTGNDSDDDIQVIISTDPNGRQVVNIPYPETPVNEIRVEEKNIDADGYYRGDASSKLHSTLRLAYHNKESEEQKKGKGKKGKGKGKGTEEIAIMLAKECGKNPAEMLDNSLVGMIIRPSKQTSPVARVILQHMLKTTDRQLSLYSPRTVAVLLQHTAPCCDEKFPYGIIQERCFNYMKLNAKQFIFRDLALATMNLRVVDKDGILAIIKHANGYLRTESKRLKIPLQLEGVSVDVEEEDETIKESNNNKGKKNGKDEKSKGKGGKEQQGPLHPKDLSQLLFAIHQVVMHTTPEDRGVAHVRNFYCETVNLLSEARSDFSRLDITMLTNILLAFGPCLKDGEESEMQDGTHAVRRYRFEHLIPFPLYDRAICSLLRSFATRPKEFEVQDVLLLQKNYSTAVILGSQELTSLQGFGVLGDSLVESFLLTKSCGVDTTRHMKEVRNYLYKFFTRLPYGEYSLEKIKKVAEGVFIRSFPFKELRHMLRVFNEILREGRPTRIALERSFAAEKRNALERTSGGDQEKVMSAIELHLDSVYLSFLQRIYSKFQAFHESKHDLKHNVNRDCEVDTVVPANTASSTGSCSGSKLLRRTSSVEVSVDGTPKMSPNDNEKRAVAMRRQGFSNNMDADLAQLRAIVASYPNFNEAFQTRMKERKLDALLPPEEDEEAKALFSSALRSELLPNLWFSTAFLTESGLTLRNASEESLSLMKDDKAAKDDGSDDEESDDEEEAVLGDSSATNEAPRDSNAACLEQNDKYATPEKSTDKNEKSEKVEKSDNNTSTTPNTHLQTPLNAKKTTAQAQALHTPGTQTVKSGMQTVKVQDSYREEEMKHLKSLSVEELETQVKETATKLSMQQTLLSQIQELKGVKADELLCEEVEEQQCGEVNGSVSQGSPQTIAQALNVPQAGAVNPCVNNLGLSSPACPPGSNLNMEKVMQNLHSMNAMGLHIPDCVMCNWLTTIAQHTRNKVPQPQQKECSSCHQTYDPNSIFQAHFHQRHCEQHGIVPNSCNPVDPVQQPQFNAQGFTNLGNTTVVNCNGNMIDGNSQLNQLGNSQQNNSQQNNAQNNSDSQSSTCSLQNSSNDNIVTLEPDDQQHLRALLRSYSVDLETGIEAEPAVEGKHILKMNHNKVRVDCSKSEESGCPICERTRALTM